MCYTQKLSTRTYNTLFNIEKSYILRTDPHQQQNDYTDDAQYSVPKACVVHIFQHAAPDLHKRRARGLDAQYILYLRRYNQQCHSRREPRRHRARHEVYYDTYSITVYYNRAEMLTKRMR